MQDNSRHNTYFISDLHLGSRSFEDMREPEARIVSWLDSIKNDAKALYMLGDVLDYWYEYKYVVPKGYVRFFGKLAELVDCGVKVYWLTGNHDIWLYSYFQKEIGIEVVDGGVSAEIDGKHFYMAHGDGVGHIKPGFRLMRSIFRNRFCQFLYSAVHPRWTVPFAFAWSRSSRVSGLKPQVQERVATEGLRALRNFVDENESTAVSPKCDYYLFGHLHVVVDEMCANGARMIVLGDWIDKYSYGKFDGSKFTIDYYKG